MLVVPNTLDMREYRSFTSQSGTFNLNAPSELSLRTVVVHNNIKKTCNEIIVAGRIVHSNA